MYTTHKQYKYNTLRCGLTHQPTSKLKIKQNIRIMKLIYVGI